MNFEEIFKKILELNPNYEIHITRWPKLSKGYSVNITELGHDYCIDKVYVDNAPSLRTAILEAWEQLTREVNSD